MILHITAIVRKDDIMQFIKEFDELRLLEEA
jgi:hypothetical protein